MFAITLANQRSFDAPAGETILNAARSNGIVLEHNCRTGRCGLCKANVTAGETVLLREEEGLAPEERAAGVVLTCCRAAASNLSLDIEDLGRLAGIETRILPSRIRALDLVAPDIMKIELRLPPNCQPIFLSGQYIDVLARGVRRSYSIANAPRPDGSIELHVRRFEDGLMSRYWFEEAKVGDLLRFEAPLGTFFLRESASTHIIFLATGTGIAPVKAMIEELVASPSSWTGKRVSIYWGNRNTTDFYWESPSSLSIDFHKVLSGPEAGWTGRRGYVQHALREDVPDLSDAEVYACGSPRMIADARNLLLTGGLPSSRYHADAFLASN